MCVFFYLRERQGERQRYRAWEMVCTPLWVHSPDATAAGPGVEPGVGNSTQVSRMGCKSPVAWAVYCISWVLPGRRSWELQGVYRCQLASLTGSPHVLIVLYVITVSVIFIYLKLKWFRTDVRTKPGVWFLWVCNFSFPQKYLSLWFFIHLHICPALVRLMYFHN